MWDCRVWDLPCVGLPLEAAQEYRKGMCRLFSALCVVCRAGLCGTMRDCAGQLVTVRNCQELGGTVRGGAGLLKAGCACQGPPMMGITK